MSNINISAEDLQRIMEAVLSKVQQLNPLEQRKYDEMIAKERRRDDLAITLGKQEAAQTKARKDNCSHLRYPATAGKLSGHMAPRGYPGAEWRTGGQAYQNGLAMMFCMHCQTNWWFKPSPDFYNQILQNGLENTAPPPDDHCICIGCYELKSECRCDAIAKEYVNAHPTVA